MKDPLISIIIPTYNRKVYLPLAIESALQQTYRNIELIVVDDGSTDGTKESIQINNGSKYRYIWQENQGVSAARNLGLSIANGKYIAFLDSDDLWHPEKIFYQVRELEKQSNKNAIAVFGSVWRIDERGKIVGKKPVTNGKNIKNYQLIDYFTKNVIYAPPSNLLIFKKPLLQIGGFDPHIHNGEDKDLIIRIRQKGEIVYLNKPLLYYRIHSASTQGIPKLENIDDVLKDHINVLNKNSSLLNEKDLQQIENTLALEYEQAAYWYFSYNAWEKGLQNLNQAIDLDRDCGKDINRLSQQISISGINNALLNGLRSTSKIVDNFSNKYYPHLVSIWPNNFLSQHSVNRTTKAMFSHIIVCNERIPKTRKENIELCINAFSSGRYLRSLATWKIFLKNLLKQN
jgi:glycosyltransferase involved in cell wall biosynthesis